MLYEIKQKLRYSALGIFVTNLLEKTPLFPILYKTLAYVGLAEISHMQGQTPQSNQRYFEQNKDNIQKIIASLADEESKKIFLDAIRFRQTKRVFIKGTTKDQYFPTGVVVLSEQEVFVDCGAFDGDSIKTFRQQTKDCYKKIIAFEPDPGNFKKLQQKKIPECICYNQGVWKANEELKFYSSGANSSVGYAEEGKISQQKESKISVCALDQMPECAEMSFLKMDIEGAELQALQGAEKTIRQKRPKLAICIYHSSKDMIEIPLWIMALNLGYTFYVRQHSADTVFYAV